MNKIVLGLCFGDEGKGSFTNYLCSQEPNSLVTRFSGGQNAGHTVHHGKQKHTFSNFGSGSFQDIPTYWSKHCTIDPVGIRIEMEMLKIQDIEPVLVIDTNCPITTPYDKLANRDREGLDQHGSCGVGIGTTVEREEKHYSLVFGDVFYPEIFREKLRLIKEFYGRVPYYDEDWVDDCFHLAKNVNIHVADDFESAKEFYPSKHIIFEGSQGLLLDQNYGFFPHVTRANTGCKNVIDLIGDEPYEVYLITRAYQTRHGNGFMTNRDLDFEIGENPHEINVQNKWQGKFRTSMLDVSLLEYAISKDPYIMKASKIGLIISCLDMVEDKWCFTYNDEVITCNTEKEFILEIGTALGIYNLYAMDKGKVRYGNKI